MSVTDEALAKYDAAMSPVLARLGSLGIVTYHELNSVISAMRQALSDCLHFIEAPTSADATVTEASPSVAEDIPATDPGSAFDREAETMAEADPRPDPEGTVEPLDQDK